MAFRVFIDPGHGGTDPGAVYNGRREKDDTLELGLAVGRILEDNGVDVVYSRTEDFYDSPYEKAMKGNEAEADLFLSIHRNSTTQPGSGTGADLLVYADTGFAADAANQIGGEIAALGFPYNGITERPNLAVLRRTKMPAVLVEAGFINNENDNQFFDDNFDALAQAIAQGVLHAAYEEPSFPPYPYSAQNSTGLIEQSRTDHPHLRPMNCEDHYEQLFADPDPAEAVREAMQESPFMGFGVMNPWNDPKYNTHRDDNANNNLKRRSDKQQYTYEQPNSTKQQYSDEQQYHNEQQCRSNQQQHSDKNQFDSDADVIKPEQKMSSENNGVRLYRVQVGAFTNPMFASQLLNQLLLEGCPAFIVYSEGLYRVQVGAFVMLDNAVMMERKLRNQGYQTFITT